MAQEDAVLGYARLHWQHGLFKSIFQKNCSTVLISNKFQNKSILIIFTRGGKYREAREYETKNLILIVIQSFTKA